MSRSYLIITRLDGAIGDHSTHKKLKKNVNDSPLVERKMVRLSSGSDDRPFKLFFKKAGNLSTSAAVRRRAIWTFVVFQYGVQLSKALSARQPGYLDFDNLPETNFTCEGKVIGGYYADIETGCQMFHVCTIGQKGDMTDIKFLCLNGTVFDQETRVCERVDEVDCSKSRDFYDLNLDLYNNGFTLPEDESGNDSSKSEESSDVEEEIYDENYDSDTEESPETSSKSPSTTSTTTPSTTTTTTTTTTPRPIVYSSIKPTFSIILPNLKNKNTGGQITGLLPTGLQNKNVPSHISSTAAPPQQQPSPQPPQQHYPNKNVGTHITGLLPTKNLQFPQTQRPYTFVTTQNYNGDQQFKQHHSGFKPYTPVTPPSTYKPPLYDPYKNHFFSSTPTPLSPIFINSYNQKSPGIEEIRQPEEPKRPVVVVTHHFPTISPIKPSYEEFSGFSSSGGGIIHPYVRQKNTRPHVGIKIHTKQPQHQHPYLQQIQHHQHHLHQHPHKTNPNILALQSQQQKVHRLHQEGLEIAEHQIAQVASRNAEISSLRSQQDEAEGDTFESQPSHRETKEIRTGNIQNFGKPSIAIVTSTSSTSSRVQKAPVITVQSVSSASGKPVISRIDYKPETEYKTELEKLFSNTEVPKKKDPQKDPDMDLEQLLLAWKLKTNQEVTKEDIEKVFARLDTSKFKNGQTISLSDIFNLMSNDSGEVEEETTRVAPMSYDEYTEEDVPYDPFFKDVPKVSGSDRQKREFESDAAKQVESVKRTKRSGRRQKGDETELRTEKPSGVELNSSLKRRRKVADRSDDQVTQVPREEEENSRTTAKSFPEVSFSCENRISGGFYADLETDCQMFHICSDSGNGSLVDHKFFCGDGTKFNQRRRICQAERFVDCKSSERFYNVNENFLFPKPEELPPELNFEPLKIKS
ncbi:hypothetical protein RUM43_006761 [Polyplax serrata]|uniref:Chitin-binding type-2 domain-containing protein n=1 Tax=Polyplax serrata TaxID=468196 RepID=A0AAN8S8B2_POLSC